MREAIRGHQRPSACNQQSTTPSRVPDEGTQCSHTICQIEARVLQRDERLLAALDGVAREEEHAGRRVDERDAQRLEAHLERKLR